MAALGSYLDARSQKGTWSLRIEDLDQARARPEATSGILRTLEQHGLLWDQEVVIQSERTTAYQDWLDRLGDQVYGCACSRREIAGLGDLTRYPGTCRDGLPPGRSARALRVRIPAGVIEFEDRIRGTVREDVQAQVGDFVVQRADGPFSYQFAVVVDDWDAGVTEVVRGADLLDSTARQIALHRLLGLPPPHYAHLPLAVDASGRKLSKLTRAPALDAGEPGAAVATALRFLGHPPPTELNGAAPAELLAWGCAHWDIARVPRTPQQSIDPTGGAT